MSRNHTHAALTSPRTAHDLMQRFEERIAAEYGGSWAVGVNSATSGLFASLLAVGVGPRHRVLVSGLSWPGTWLPAASLGADLVPVDLLPTWPVMDPKCTHALLNRSAAAVVSVGLFGFTEGLSDIHAVTRGVKTYHILDAAQLAGPPGDTRPLAELADLVVISLGPGKHGTPCGGGGAVIGTDRTLYQRLMLATQHPLRVHDNALCSDIRDAADGFAHNLGIHPLAARAYLSQRGGLLRWVDFEGPWRVLREYGVRPAVPPPALSFPRVTRTILASVARSAASLFHGLATALTKIGWTVERCPYVPIDAVFAKRRALYPWLDAERHRLQYSETTLSMSRQWADSLVIITPDTRRTR